MQKQQEPFTLNAVKVPSSCMVNRFSSSPPSLAARLLALPLIGVVRIYRYTLSAFMGRTCRFMPSCSEYTEEALRRHGGWAGGWMGLARICRCRPGGGDGLDFVCDVPPETARWYLPWRYGKWR